LKRYLAAAGALAAVAGACAADGTDDSLTWFGVTLYGTVDVGYTYQNRGAPLNDYYPSGLEYLLQKNSSRSISSLSENGMSQSKVGLRGVHEFVDGWSGVFKLETGFNPLSGNISDALKSVAQNNGVSLAQQSTNGDSSRAGQPFQGAAYAGVSSPKYGTLTFGRQNALLLDNILNYDPMAGSYAFSLPGYSGTAGGSGYTEDARLDNSVKYSNQVGSFRVSGQFQSGIGTGSGGNTTEFDLGADPFPGFSFDAAYGNKKDAVLAAPLSAAQVAALPKSIAPNNAVAATVSDNWSWQVNWSYFYKAARFSFGYENIRYRNPQTPLLIGTADVGGYTIGAVNNPAGNNLFPTNKILQVIWTGAKYSFSPHLDLAAAWYYLNQNHYNAAARCPGGIADAGACSGRASAYSFVADYRFNRHFDAYTGFMYSHYADGLAAGYLSTWTIDPTIGGRFSF
jgi:predicted porin